MTTDIKLFRYNVCILKSELNHKFKLNYKELHVSDILDTYAIVQQWAMNVYCKSDLSKPTSEELLIQKIMKKEAARAYENYLFWSKYNKEN